MGTNEIRRSDQARPRAREIRDDVRRAAASDLRSKRHRPRASRRAAVHPGHPADDVPRTTLDHAPVRRFRNRRRVKRAVPLPPRARPDRALRRVRSPHADGLRRRRSARGRRGGEGRSLDQLVRRLRASLRRHSHRPGDDFDDHQRHGRDPPRNVCRDRETAGRRRRPCRRHDAERHPEGVHRPRDVYLPAATLHAARDRSQRVLL